MRRFEDVFSALPQTVASAPGRVNLLGEHTDYNEGFVLPTVIPQQTTVSLGLSNDGKHHFYSSDLDEMISCEKNAETTSGFGKYVIGCIRVLDPKAGTIPPLNIHISSTIPMGAGLSSSAALEIATLRCLRKLLEVDVDNVQLALLGQQAETIYAGVTCGIMDQMASSLAVAGQMLFLDTRTLERRLLPFPEGTEVLILDSGTPRTLATSGYNRRRAECEAAADALNVPALRDIESTSRLEVLPSPLKRRAWHVVTENLRVLEVLSQPTAKRFGTLMNDSHASLRNDYEVSVQSLDILVGLLQTRPEVFGARLTGAGFGGACVALVEKGAARKIGTEVLERYYELGYTGTLLVPPETRVP